MVLFFLRSWLGCLKWKDLLVSKLKFGFFCLMGCTWFFSFALWMIVSPFIHNRSLFVLDESGN